MSDEEGPETPVPTIAPEAIPEAEEELARLDVRLAEIRATRPPKGTLQGSVLREYRQLCARKANLVKRLGRQVRDRPGLRLVKAVAAERFAGKAVEEIAAMLEDSTKVLRLAVNEYGKIARNDLAPWYLKRLKTGTPKQQEQAAKALKEIFESNLEAMGALKERTDRKKASPGWPSEGAKS